MPDGLTQPRIHDIYGRGGGCFPAKTLIATPNGHKAIEELREGDEVISFDHTGALHTSKVVKRVRHPSQPVTGLKLWGGSVLPVTPNHWVLNQYGAFVAAGSLTEEDAVVNGNNHLLPVIGFEKRPDEPVFNITVVPHHTFIAEGVRVHNGGLGIGALDEYRSVQGRGGGGGKGGGGAPHSPVEAPNTLRSKAIARAIDLLCEGPIVGLVDGAKSVFLNETQLEDSSGQRNFEGITYDMRLGLPEQDPLIDQEGTETEVGVGVEVTVDGGPVVRSISNLAVDDLRVRVQIPQLLELNTTNGDTNPFSVQFAVEYRSQAQGNWIRGGTLNRWTSFSGSQSPASNSTGISWSIRANASPGDTTTGSYNFSTSYRKVGDPTWIPIDSGSGVIANRLVQTIDTDAESFFDGEVFHPGGVVVLEEHYEAGSITRSYSLQGLDPGQYEIQVVGCTLYAQRYLSAGDIIINGKNTSPYEIQFRFALDKENVPGPWDVRVRRISPDEELSARQNRTIFMSFTEIVNDKFFYPNSVVVGSQADSELFGGNVPSRAFEIYGLIIKVPSNYNTTTRAYTGTWNGSFKLAWTDNPAWVLYDVLTNKRYGCGINPDSVDKWGLYQIAQYCDELVDDGFGGEEPRFTFNGVIQTRQEAFHVLSAIVSNFRGMIYWASGAVAVAQDRPREPDMIVGRANVLEGRFSYSGTSDRQRHNSVRVIWNDPQDFYRQAVEVVEDNTDIAARGLRDIDIAAFGCTSRGQAHRFGKWLLDTELNQPETVTYKAGLDHMDLAPGAIVSIVDPNVSGADFFGRFVEVDGTTLTLDRTVLLASGQSYEITALLPDGTLEERAIITGAGSHTVLEISSGFSATPVANGVWSISGTDVAARQFRIVSITEVDQFVFEVSALLHDPGKYARIEQGIVLDPVVVTRLGTGAGISPPLDMNLTEGLFKSNNQVRTRLTVSWVAAPDNSVQYYRLEGRSPNENWRPLVTTSNLSYDVLDAEPGLWDFRIYSITPFGESLPLQVLQQPVLGKTAPPADVEGLTATRDIGGIQLTWNEVTDLDLIGYQVREGDSWDSATILVELLIGTTVFINVTNADTKTYLVKAIDELRTFSDAAATVQSSALPPSDVTEFQAVAKDEHVTFTWEPVAGKGIEYQIRVGATWEVGLLLAKSSSDNVTILYPGTTVETFWIKAVTLAGLFSENAAYSLTQLKLGQARNVVIAQNNRDDPTAGDYTGYSPAMAPGASDTLLLDEISTGVYRRMGEHWFDVDLGASIRARNWLSTRLVNFSGVGPTWEEMTDAWQDIDDPWLPSGNTDGATLTKFITEQLSELPSDIVHGFKLDGDLTDEAAAATNNEAVNVSYDTARYSDGAIITDLTAVNWTVAIPETFTFSFRVATLAGIEQTATFCQIYNTSPERLINIGYNAATGVFYADDGTNRLEVTLSKGMQTDFLTVAITQNSTTRALYVRSENTKQEVYATLAVSAPGTFNRLYLYEAN